MKKLFIIALFLPLMGLGQNSLLYEVKKPGTNNVSYLFGTMHVQDERAFHFNDSVVWAIDQCDKAAFELDLSVEALKEFDMDVLMEAVDTGFIRSLAEYIQQDFIPKLVDQVPADDLAQKITSDIIPAYMNLVMEMYNRDNRTDFVDAYLQNYASSQGKEIIGIETLQEQLIALLGETKNIDLSKRDYSNIIIKQLNKDDWKFNFLQSLSANDEMIEIYAKHDLEGLMSYIDKYRKEGGVFIDRFYKRLLDDRNDLMFERTKDDLANGGMFIAVGAGHLGGKSGLINQFEDAGYSIRPINVSTPFRRETNWTTRDFEGYSVDLPEGIELSSISMNSIYMGRVEQEMNANIHYTGLGKASFDISERPNHGDEAVEEAFDMQAFLEAMGDMQESQTEEAVEYYEEIDEAEAIEEGDYDAVPEQIDIEEDVVYEIVDDNIEIDEIEEVTPPTEVYIEADYDELIEYSDEYAVEEAVEEAAGDAIEYAGEDVEVTDDGSYYYEESHDHDEDYSYEETYDYEESEPNPFSRQSFMSALTEEQEQYFETVGTAVESHFKESMSQYMSTLMADMMGGTKDTLYYNINGEETMAILTKSMLNQSLQAEVVTEETIYTLTVNGDPSLLKSDEIEQFFTSFKLK